MGTGTSTGDARLAARDTTEPRFTRDRKAPPPAPDRDEFVRVAAERDQAVSELRGALTNLREAVTESGDALAAVEEACRREAALRSQVDALRNELYALRTDVIAAQQPGASALPSTPAEELPAPEPEGAANASLHTLGRWLWATQAVVGAVTIVILALALT
jgi:hypothetical protein